MPTLTTLSRVEVDGDRIIYSGIHHAEQRQVQLPEDFYLRELRDLSADDLDGVAEVLSSYGLLFNLDLDDFPKYEYDPEDFQPFQDLAEEDVPSVPEGYGSIHRELIRLYLETAQEAISVWLACQKEGGLEELAAQTLEADSQGQWAESITRAEGTEPSPERLQKLTIESLLLSLDSTVNAALSGYSVGLRSLEDRRTTVYSASFLQMYNHMVEGVHARTCANETCRRLFVRQRGRSAYGQHRTVGVIYCSRECARAQAARRHRRNQREKAS